jgi:hypothetical protein
MTPLRIAMWSGPRNISTAMLRAFENRADCAVVDEPFYAAYLSATGLDHPLREKVVASQPTDWREVVAALIGPIPLGKPIYYQKHMTHHMLPKFGREWIGACVNVFLIRAPEAVLASYARRREDFTLDEIGLPAQADLFSRAADELGHAPPVIDGRDVLENPEGMLKALCRACNIAFDPAMLAWPPGRRISDGVWAPAWYDAVERSTGFAAPRPEPTLDDLDETLKAIAAAARPIYERLAQHRLRAEPLSGGPAQR